MSVFNLDSEPLRTLTKVHENPMVSSVAFLFPSLHTLLRPAWRFQCKCNLQNEDVSLFLFYSGLTAQCCASTRTKSTASLATGDNSARRATALVRAPALSAWRPLIPVCESHGMSIFVDFFSGSWLPKLRVYPTFRWDWWNFCMQIFFGIMVCQNCVSNLS